MGSLALQSWNTERAEHLNALREVHSNLTGGRRGRQWATEQLNHALIARLISEFQGFSRDLHDEAIDFIFQEAVATSPSIEPILRSGLLNRRGLDTGNPTLTNLASDFSKLGLTAFRARLGAHNSAAESWLADLSSLNEARNAIAHGDDVKLAHVLQTHRLTQETARRWRTSLNRLARGMDSIVGAYLKSLTGKKPW
ncbi:HEPN domain-containing protein [Arthrobacter sp. AZCC_0090]|uniref:HEPN domain-containing protein n=1 Tax=Arthrobacter sp. AZCC_0090 TaxID=2735881 RepID=UPI00161A7CA2|nr:HEPN domain-containing protein [Arthrobacter sp. AZCC_0090]MBB6406179.1 hypothetical protein [Arthrobacter sp. AZCC_0090]